MKHGMQIDRDYNPEHDLCADVDGKPVWVTWAEYDLQQQIHRLKAMYDQQITSLNERINALERVNLSQKEKGSDQARSRERDLMTARIYHRYHTCHNCEQTVATAIVLTIGSTPVTLCIPCWRKAVRAVERAERRDRARS